MTFYIFSNPDCCRYTRKGQKGKYDFVTKDTDFTIKNVSYEAPTGDKESSRAGIHTTAQTIYISIKRQLK